MISLLFIGAAIYMIKRRVDEVSQGGVTQYEPNDIKYAAAGTSVRQQRMEVVNPDVPKSDRDAILNAMDQRANTQAQFDTSHNPVGGKIESYMIP